ncbi:MAG: sigma factor-like helix-turn-helix DNA-binding protein, partial [Patescibacteria group bacterium]
MKELFKKIIKEKKRDELIKLNAVEIVNQVFSDLQERERDVLSRRFALGWDDSQTLEEIGKLHNLTRERVRQIERASLDKIKKMENLNNKLESVREVVAKILDEHGGVMEREFLLDILSVLTLEMSDDDLEDKKKNYRNYFDFILSNLLNDYIEKVDNHVNFGSFYKIKDKAINYLEELVDELKEKMFSLNKTVKFNEAVDLIK